jgi:Tfp pilus assembly protein PilV
MLHSICNKQGISLVEVLIAIFLTSVGLMAIMTMQPTAWRTAASSDFRGRAAEILHSRLETAEQNIMNPCVAVNAGITNTAVLASSQVASEPVVPGDMTFNVQTNIQNLATSTWRVNITVTWPGNTVGINSGIVVIRQERFRFPAGCPSV